MTEAFGALSFDDIARDWAAAMWGLGLKGTLLLMVVGAAVLLAGRASAAIRHLLWTLGIAGVLAMPLLVGVLPGWEVQPPREIPLPVGALRFVPPEPDPFGTPPPPATPPEFLEPGAPAGATGDAPASARSEDLAGADDTGDGSDTVPGAEMRSRLSVWLLWVWLAGVILIAGRFLHGGLRLRLLSAQARDLTSAEDYTLVAEVAHAMGLRGRIRVLLSASSLSPQIWGLSGPTILLPREWFDWDEEQQRQVLIHELAHVRRRDCLTQSLADLSCALYWFNPLVWYAAHRMRVERERACDDIVLESGSRASTYADHLLAIAATIGRFGRPAFGEVSMARRSQMSGRLLAVLDPDRRRREPRRGFVVATSALVLLLALSLAALDAAGLEPDSADFASEQTMTAADVDLDEFKKAWHELGRRMIEAVRDRDAASLADSYTRRSRLYAHGLPTIYGRDEVEENAPTFWTAPVWDVEFKDMEFYQVGDKVCVVGGIRAFDRRGELLGSSRFMSLYKFERGSWRIHRDIVNN